MNLFQFIDPAFHALNDGKVIRIAVTWAIRVMAVILGVIGVVWCIGFIALGIKGSDTMFGNRSAELLIAVLLFSVFGLAFGYLECGVCLFRAKSVSELREGHFIVLPILSILLRLLGEITCIAYGLIGIGGGLVLWIAGFNPLSSIGSISLGLPFEALGSGGLIGGLEFAIFMLLLAFGAIALFYALAEFTVVAVEIANNTRALATPELLPAGTETLTKFKISNPAASTVPNGHSSSKTPFCKDCSQPLEMNAAFCAECGKPVAA